MRFFANAALVTGAAFFVSGPGLAADLSFSDQSASTGIEVTQVPSVSLVIANIDVWMMVGGATVGDFNNDGWQDLFVVMSGGSSDRLFMNQGDGTFIDRAAEAGLAELHMGIGACAGDYDGDGWMDIFEVSFGPVTSSPQPGFHKLWRNNGDGTFSDVGRQVGLSSLLDVNATGWGPAFGDYDLDGDLDLAIPSWTAGGTRLFRNNGDGTFVQVTIEAGIYNPTIRGFSAKFADMNNDRYPELLVAADFGTSRYYINNRDGTFTDHTEASGTGLDGNGMGHAVADIDGDGLLDWYVTSVHSADSGMLGVPGTGNFLYRNEGNHLFTVYPDVVVNDGGWGWGTESVDLDHDGLVDLVETNGWRQVNGDHEYEWDGEGCYVYRHNPDGTFTNVADSCGLIDHYQGRGLVRFDYDNDGDQDIVVLANSDPTMVFRNDLEHGPDTHWIRLFFDTTNDPTIAPHGYGTRVLAHVGGETMMGYLSGGSTFMSQSELSIHLGLGTADRIDELEIHWANGTVDVLRDVAVDRTLTIRPHVTALQQKMRDYLER